MARNYNGEGDVLTLTAPYTVTSGSGAKIGKLFVVALGDVLIGARGEFATEGEWILAALSTATGAEGADVFWDDTNKRVDTDGTVGMPIGRLTQAKTNGQAVAYVKLNESSSVTAEGPQPAIASFTDSTGAGANDSTLADGLTATALTENAGAIGGTNDGNLPDLTATAATLTGTLTGTTDGSLSDVADIALSTGNTYTDAAVNGAVNAAIASVNLQLKELQTQLNAAIADNVALRAGVREVANRVNTCVTDLTVQNQNDSDIAAKVNVLLSELRVFGAIATA